MKVYAIARDAQRREEWQTVYGSAQVPVRSQIQKRGQFPALGTVLFYELDVTALTPEQTARLERHIAQKFALDVARVREDIFGAHGVPILAKDIDLVNEAGKHVSPIAPTFAISTRMVM